MSEMNPYLAAMYNTNGAGEQMTEDMQKTATTELFCKLAADNGLDLSQMTDDQIASVYAQVFPEEVAKLAEEKEEGEKHEKKEAPAFEAGEREEEKEEKKEDKDEKEVKASAYFQEKQAWVEKNAEADWMGRVMAHAFTQEKDVIEQAKLASLVEQVAQEGMSEEEIVEAVKEAASMSTVEKLHGAAKAVAEKARAAGGAVKDVAKKVTGVGDVQKGVQKSRGAEKMLERGPQPAAVLRGIEKGQERGRHLIRKGVAKGAATLAVGAGAEEAVRRGLKKDKEASAQAFEEISANHAIKVAEASGYDVEQAQSLVNAVYTLGLTESEKIAHVQDVDTAVHVRGLEYLEAAGYPVNWEEIFGS